MTEFLPQVSSKPVLVQNEIHPYYQEKGIVEYMHSQGIVVEAWYPLGGRGHTAALLGNETISRIAAAHGKSSAQVILRWDLQRGGCHSRFKQPRPYQRKYIHFRF